METEARTEAYAFMHTIMMRHYREDRLDEAFELAGKLLLVRPQHGGITCPCQYVQFRYSFMHRVRSELV